MKYAKLLKVFIALILLWGVAIRIFLYLQNRDLIIDEANIARNLYERGLAQLALPLNYEQYAPPVFLWIEKVFVTLLGYSEYALRLYPLLAGIASLFLFTLVMERVGSLRSVWYSLFLMVVSYTFIRYSSEVKQYMPDMMITLGLIYAALTIDIQKIPGARFFITWLVLGSVAIWASMPSIFILSGIGCYYLYLCTIEKDRSQQMMMAGIGAAWSVQFLIYYIVILRPEANSEYLQTYHAAYFLNLVPKNIGELKHNWYLFLELLNQSSGYAVLCWKFNLVMMITGIIFLIKKDMSRAMLIIVPVFLALLAAALHQFSLIPRVSLFMMPLFLLMIGYGVEQVMQTKLIILQAAMILMAFYAIKNFNITPELLKHPNKDEVLTDEFAFLKKHNIAGGQLYIGNGSTPAYIYYTQIHPGKGNWQQLTGATLLHWDSNYEDIATHAPDTSAFLYTAVGQEELKQHKAVLEKYLRCTDSIEIIAPRCFVYLFVKK
jgi:hypothetical protein